MQNKEYRELQISSSHLVVIFIAILVLGIVIFLLGVSVGKKQALIIKQTQISPLETVTPPQKEKPAPEKESKSSISEELAAFKQTQKETEEVPLTPQKTTLYYIQVGAFKDRTRADSLAESFKKKGYSTIVLDPSNRRPYYRVRLGGYETKEEASQEVQKLIKSEKKNRRDFLIIKY